MSRPMDGRLALWWRRSSARVGTAFGIVVVLTVWGVAINAVAQFGRPATASAASAAARITTGPHGTEGGPVQDLASPTPYFDVPSTTDAVPPASSPVSTPGQGSASIDPGTGVPAAVAAATPVVTTDGTASTAGSSTTSTAGSSTTSTSGSSTTTSSGSGISPTAGSSPEVVVDDTAQTAAARYGWGAPTKIDTFDDPALPGWDRYNGPGHQGKGIRSPNALTAANGVLTISGDAQGTTGGMAWGTGQKYGRWEGRMRAPVGDGSYHAVMLLWPDAENWPVGGEVDFSEISDATRRSVDGFLHYGADNNQSSGTVATDATQWHAWAVEWNPAGITYFLDGRPWFQDTDAAHLPPGPMHLCLQLDWFPEGGGPVTPTQMQVDDVAYYPVTGTGVSPTIPPGPGSTITPAPPATTAPVTTTTSAPTTTTPAPTTSQVPTTVPTSSPVTTTTVPTTAPTTTVTTTTVPTTAPTTTAPTTTRNVRTTTVTEPPTTTAVPRTSTSAGAPATTTAKTTKTTTTKAAATTTAPASKPSTAAPGASGS